MSEGREQCLSITPATLPWATFGGRTTTSESGTLITEEVPFCEGRRRKRRGRTRGWGRKRGGGEEGEEGGRGREGKRKGRRREEEGEKKEREGEEKEKL